MAPHGHKACDLLNASVLSSLKMSKVFLPESQRLKFSLGVSLDLFNLALGGFSMLFLLCHIVAC